MKLCFDDLNGSGNDGFKELNGKKLLNLLKSLEKCYQNKTDACEIESEIIDELKQMATLFDQYGLFSPEVRKEKLSSVSAPSTGTKKRKRGGGSGNSGKISSILNVDGGGNTSEEAYVMSNLCRVLIPTSSKGQIYSAAVIAACAAVLDCICQYCINNFTQAANLETDMIVSIASNLISGLAKTTKAMMVESQHELAITACLNCAKRVMVVSNLKLSRNATVIASIKGVAEDILFDNRNDSVDGTESMEAAASLIATIPIVGNANGVSPIQLWSDTVKEKTKELSGILCSFFPLVKKFRKGKQASLELDSELIKTLQSSVISQADRVMIFMSKIRGMVSILSHLLEMDGYDFSNTNSGASLPLVLVLDALEQLLHFSNIAETRYLATKSKLRDVSVEGGLLSASSAVLVANSVKYLGFALLQAICSMLTSSSLQYGKRLLELSLLNLQQSSSLALKRVIDPSSFTERNSDKKWCHRSIVLRMKSVEAFTLLLQRLGPNASVAQNDIFTKSLAFVAGNILEQINVDEDIPETEAITGTQQQRIELLSKCFDCLSITLSVCGGFLSIENRELIESICSRSLTDLDMNFNECALIKISILKLGASCMSTPWPDGAASGLTQSLLQYAMPMRYDRDTTVSSMAFTTVGVCNLTLTPRAPPLIIISRAKESDDSMTRHKKFFSMSSMEEGMQSAQEDILRSKIASKEKMELKKKQKQEADERKKREKEERIKTKEEDKSSLNQFEEKATNVDSDDASPDQVDKEIHITEVEKVLHESDQDMGGVSSGSDDNDDKEDAASEKMADDESEDDDNDDDDDFPPIIDCGPDEEDDL